KIMLATVPCRVRGLVLAALLAGVLMWSGEERVWAEDKPPVPPANGNSTAAVQPGVLPLTIAPNTPIKEMLPVPPQSRMAPGPWMTDDPSKVPEVEFQLPLPRELDLAQAIKQTADTLAKINHVNAKKRDAFMEGLRAARPDLAGLPFTLGDACRT